MLLFISIQLSAQEKTTVAVLDFDAFGISEFEVKSLTNRLRGILVRQKEYRVVERGLMTQILKEQGFQQTGCSSDECVVEIGQILGVKFMLAGSFGVVGDLFTIDMRLIDVETGGILKSSLTDIEGSISDVLKTGLNQALSQLLYGEDISFAPKETKTLQLNTSPTAATVLLDGDNVGKTPLSLPDLTVGKKYDISLNLDYFQEKNIVLEVTKQMPPTVTITLDPASGNVSFEGQPEKAKVYIDGSFYSRRQRF